jgi:large subunit ribosomal protein L10
VRKQEKAEVVAGLQEKLAQGGSVILTDYRGLTVKDITELRIALAKLGATTQVVKNTLLQRSLSGLFRAPSSWTRNHAHRVLPISA